VSSVSLACDLTQCKAVKWAQKHFGGANFEAVLRRLDHLTQDVARTTAGETFKVVYGLIRNMNVVMDGE